MSCGFGEVVEWVYLGKNLFWESLGDPDGFVSRPLLGREEGR